MYTIVYQLYHHKSIDDIADNISPEIVNQLYPKPTRPI